MYLFKLRISDPLVHHERLDWSDVFVEATIAAHDSDEAARIHPSMGQVGDRYLTLQDSFGIGTTNIKESFYSGDRKNVVSEYTLTEELFWKHNAELWNPDDYYVKCWPRDRANLVVTCLGETDAPLGVVSRQD